MERVEFGRWTLLVDREATKKAYEGCAGWTQECDCDACRNFLMARDRAFGPKVLELLDRLGIEVNCETEAYLVGPREPRRYQCSGWFHFVGRIEAGGDARREIDSTSWTLDFEAVDGFPDVEIAFTADSAIQRGKLGTNRSFNLNGWPGYPG
jgi:hypothetical protein